MPRYFFDVQDDTGSHPDDTGLELKDMETAIVEARRALADMAREALVSGNTAPVQIIIRDDGEAPVRLAIHLTTERIHD